MNPYQNLVEKIAALVENGNKLPLGEFTIEEREPQADGAPVAMILSPHPDDECIIGGLPLRLQRENGYRVINVAVTQGSHPERQIPRLEELIPACKYLNFELVQTDPRGLSRIKPEVRESDPCYWSKATEITKGIIEKYNPKIILFPHELDQNSGHVGVNLLAFDALKACDDSISPVICETEFWSPMRDPNLLMEISNKELTDMLTALSFHVGEVKRNPYHIRTPMWMVDNVRRGGEIVGKQGGSPPDFTYGVIYRLSQWNKNQKNNFLDEGVFISAHEDICQLIPGLS